MANDTRQDDASTGKFMVLCAAVRGAFSGAARSVTDWIIRAFLER
ncbi:hypothetical protein ACWEGS_28970 [Streptomyces sp. NPDC004822]